MHYVLFAVPFTRSRSTSQTFRNHPEKPNKNKLSAWALYDQNQLCSNEID